MMEPTVQRLSTILRVKPTKRDLVCPACHRVIILSGGKLWCWGGCSKSYETLSELAAIERKAIA